MVDVSKTTGTKASRAARTRVDVSQGRTEASTRLRRSSRVVEGGGKQSAATSVRLAQAFSDFFPNAIQEGAQDVAGYIAAEQRRKNRDELLRLETAVRQNPAEARKAVMDRDYTSFLANESFASQAAVVDGFRTMVAREAALTDFETEVKTGIASLPPGADPTEFVSTYLQDQLKGADPLFAAEYSTIIGDKARPVMAQYNQSVLNQQTIKSLDMAETVMRGTLETGEIPTTVEGMQTMRSEMIGALPLSTPEAVDRADARFEAVLMDEAANGNAAALRMMTMADPAYDGLSIAERRPKEYEAAINSAISRSRQVRTVQAENDLNDIDNGIAAAGAGLGGAPTIGDLMARIIDHEEVHGESNKWRSKRDAVLSLARSKAEDDNNFARIVNNLSTTYSTSDWNKKAPGYWDGSVASAQAEKFGFTPEQAQQFADKELARMGFGSDLKQRQSANLLTSTNVDELAPLFNRLRRMDGISGGLDERHLTDQGLQMYALMDFATEAGLDPIAARNNFLENRDTAGSPLDYLARQTDEEGRARGQKGVIETSKKVWSGIEDTFPGEGGLFGGDLDYEDLTPAARAELAKATNVAAFMTHGNVQSDEAIAKIAGKLVRGKLGIQMDQNGDLKVDLDKTPDFVLGKNGEILPAAKVDRAVLERGKAAIENNPILSETIGGFSGLEQDDLTAAGYGLAVKSQVGGIPMSVSYLPGQRFVVPTDTLPEGNTFFLIEHLGDGNSVVNVPSPDGGDVDLGDGVTMKYAPEIGQWVPRYIDRGDARTVEEVLGPVGSPLAMPTDKPPAPPEEGIELRRIERSVINAMKDRGQIVAEPDDGVEGLEARVRSAVSNTKALGYPVDDAAKGIEAQFYNRTLDHIAKVEGTSFAAYDDHTSKLVKPGTKVKGNVTIGHGFNLDDPLNKKIVEKLGLDYAGLRSGKKLLKPSEANKLTQIKMDEAHSFLKEHFKGVDLKQHQMQALISLVYNSRWTKRGPTLIGPRITKAIREGRWEDAATEIRDHSMAGTPPKLAKGIQARRTLEADLFLGRIR